MITRRSFVKLMAVGAAALLIPSKLLKQLETNHFRLPDFRAHLYGMRGRAFGSHVEYWIATGDGLMPAGHCMAFYFRDESNPIPEGWLRADGRRVSASQYPKLFAAIGRNYG